MDWRGRAGKEMGAETYQISQRVQLLAHHAALLPPTGHLAIHEIEKQTEGKERKRVVEVALVGGVAKAVTQRGEEGENTAEAWESCTRVSILFLHVVLYH